MLGLIRGILSIPFFLIIYILIPLFCIIGLILYGVFSMLKWIWT